MPRTYFQPARLCRVCLLILLTCTAGASALSAQKKRADKLSPVQQTALTYLDQVVDELRGVEDLDERTAISREVVKLLAPKNRERCRSLLDALFNDVLKAVEASRDGEAAQQKKADSVMRDVIKIAAAFDSNLANSYVTRYAESKEQNSSSASSSLNSSLSATLSPQMAEMHLRIATELVESNPALAASVAEKTAGGAVIPQTLVFLEVLRKKDVPKANSFLLLTLRHAAQRQAEDVNELLLLYAYVFSPTRIPYVAPEGLTTRRIGNHQDVAENRQTDPVLARQYLQAVTQILAQPERYTSGVARLTAGSAGDLYFISLIQPHALTYLPEVVEPLTAQRTLLVSALEPDKRAPVQESTESWSKSPTNTNQNTAAGASVESLLSRADKQSNPNVKDQMYYMAATMAVRGKNYPAALNAVEKMSVKSGDEAKPFILFSIAEAEVGDGKLENAEQSARLDKDPVRRSYILNLIANSMIEGQNKNLARASEILTEIEQMASKFDSPKEKIATLVGAATSYARLGDARSFELFRSVIQTANKTDEFTGSTRLNRNLNVGGFTFSYSLYEEQFSFNDLINRLGRKDFGAALADAQSLKSRVPRLKAIVNVCRAALAQS